MFMFPQCHGTVFMVPPWASAVFYGSSVLCMGEKRCMMLCSACHDKISPHLILIAVQGGIALVIKMQSHAASKLVDAVH